MRFLPTDEQNDFARSLRALFGAADVPAVARAWGAGDQGPGRRVWARAAATGLFALAADEAYDGLGPLPVELALGFVEWGRSGMPGPAVETAAVAVLLSRLGDGALAKRFLPSLLAGEALATLTLPGGGPYALDADAAAYRFRVSDAGGLWLARAPGEALSSTDPTRRLFRPAVAGDEPLADGPRVVEAAGVALDWARLLTAAQCLGAGETLLARTVEYAKQRTQFGTPIGGFQAVKHRLADTLLALEFARPLLWAGALSLDRGEVAAAKLTAGEAAYAAAMTALRVHGAIGYTQELDLSLWLRKARPLRDAWGTPSQCRAVVLEARRPLRGRPR
ncbi:MULTISPECIES: acyl-CoA dehydrogenase family protein [unclassified Streptomyces]|uniref:acyl-CoA dehydrogenase family protein n=1 Tax=unclassified Streptomyces TaxID=2593676 RepID=UPI00109E6CEB|nr:acyl-CoA dehydrogenase family protein [Streptomyces sp. A1136]THA44371.1 acyl-CoA dehydrogenase [Streptomyces sp. A1136]